MGPIDLLVHLLNFAAPAFAVALALALGARLVEGKKPATRAWYAYAAINFVAGLAASAAGLAYFGQDGRMATYAALVGASATSHWILSRGWRWR